MPNAAFALLIALTTSLAIAGPSSIARLVLAGNQGHLSGSGQYAARCLLVPTTSDLTAHLLSYGILFAVLAGAVVGSLSLLSQWRQTDRFVAELLLRTIDHPEDLDRLIGKLGLGGRVDLIEAEEPRCFCYGLARPRVSITTGLLATLTGVELEAVLRHEAYHVRNYDPLRLILGRALASAFFFVPAIRDLFGHYRLHVELAADKRVIRQMREPRSLAAALDKLLDARAIGPTAVPGAAHGTSLELRIDSLLGEPVRSSIRARWPRLVLSGLVVLLVAAPALAFAIGADREVLSALGATPHATC